MKRKLMNKNAVMLLTATGILLLSGCGGVNPGEKPSEDAKGSYMTTEGFYQLSDICDSYTLKMEGTKEDGKTFTGEFALGSGEKDKIIVADNAELSGDYIEINGIKKEIVADDIEAVKFADIDEGDAYKELILFDAGPSADPCLRIYRFCADTIYELGAYNGNEYDDILTDKKGKLIDEDGYVDFIDTQIVTEYVEVTDNKAASKMADSSAAMNQTYKLSKNVTVAFCETESDKLEDAEIELDNTIELKSGEEIKLIKVDTEKHLYFVELANGKKGVFTTHLAG